MELVNLFIAIQILILPCTTNGKTLFENDQNIDKLVEAINEFAFNFHRLSTTESCTVFAPFSLSTVLSMLYHGSNGTTAEELRKGLGYDLVGLDNDASIQSSYKKLLGSHTPTALATTYVGPQVEFDVKPVYTKFIQEVYNSPIREIDCAHSESSAFYICSVNLICLNTAHFEGSWNEKFNANLTTPEIFYNKGLDSNATTVDMMHQKGEFRYINDVEGTDTEVLELPYEGRNFSMWILLPRGVQGGLEYVESKLTANTVRRLKANMRNFTVDLSLPKFKVEYRGLRGGLKYADSKLAGNMGNFIRDPSLHKTNIDYGGDVSSTLKQMGIANIFQNANLERISDNLKVVNVFHRVQIDVNESGTKVPASSDIIVDNSIKIAEKEHTTFIVNHPFLFFILDNRNDAVLFIGRVEEM